MKILDFQRHSANIRNSFIHYSYFLIHLNNICTIFMEHSRSILIFNIPGTLFWEYSPEFHRELFPNIPGIYHWNVPPIFHDHIFSRWVFMKIFMKIKICLILAFIQKIQSFLILSKKKLLVKMKDEVKGKINSESVGLKSKMYSLVIVVSEKNLKSKWSQ